MLKLHGVEFGKEEDTISDPVLLSEVMEMREAIESAQTQPELVELRRKNESELRRVLARVSEAFRTVASLPRGTEEYREALSKVEASVLTLTYLQTIDQELLARLDVG